MSYGIIVRAKSAAGSVRCIVESGLDRVKVYQRKEEVPNPI
jgi:hypothetical protein